MKADNRQNHLLQSHQGNEEKCLQFIVDSQNGDGVLRELFENQIQADNVKRVKRLHHNGRDSGPIDSDTVLQPYFSLKTINAENRSERNEHGCKLACYCGKSSACSSRFRHAEHAENQNGIQNHIDNGARYLRDHGREHIPLRLQDFGTVGFDEKPQRACKNNLRVWNPLFLDRYLVRGYGKIASDQKQSRTGENHVIKES